MDEESQQEQARVLNRRFQTQSRTLLWVSVPLLALAALVPPTAARKLGLPLWSLRAPLLFSAGFALLVWILRAATPAACTIGFLICFALAQSPEVWNRYSPYPASHSALAALVAVFVLTFAATKYGRKKKEARGLSEPRKGRQASQIVANLGVAALFAAAGRFEGSIAALAEAAADTVSSEIGQASGQSALLLTTWHPVPAGTDGGITLVGTLAGITASALIVIIGAPHHTAWLRASIWLSACMGLFFDSLLGATVERRGWIGNDLVNFSSTLFAALLATLLAQ